MKLGIIRCMQTEDYCPGTADFKAARLHMGAFAQVEEEIEIVGFTSCGGCPGKKAVLRARELVKRGADAIAFASCIQKGTPIGYPCPFHQKMQELVEKEEMCIRDRLDFDQTAVQQGKGLEQGEEQSVKQPQLGDAHRQQHQEQLSLIHIWCPI